MTEGIRDSTIWQRLFSFYISISYQFFCGSTDICKIPMLTTDSISIGILVHPYSNTLSYYTTRYFNSMKTGKSILHSSIPLQNFHAQGMSCMKNISCIFFMYFCYENSIILFHSIFIAKVHELML